MATQEQINKFFRNECNSSERKLVLEYFEKNPEQWDNYLDEEEWEQFEVNDKIDPHVSRKLFDKISRETVKKSSISKKSAWIAAAASIILIIGLGVLLTNNKGNIPAAVVQNGNITDTVKSVIHHEVNTTGKLKRILLSDGTIIILYNKSEVTYIEPFDNKREIVLLGKAFFKVAKNKTKPFTVTSRDILTTAIGTEFTVTAYGKSHEIIVQLHEGKVVIKPVKTGDRRMKREIYLLPGQQFVFNNKAIALWNGVQKKNASEEKHFIDEINGDDPSTPSKANGTWYMFNNQTLEHVLDQLASMFSVEITFKKKDIKGIYFTGKYDRSDSLDIILNDIATIHHLKITKKENAYVISR